MEGIRRLSFCAWGVAPPVDWSLCLSHFRGNADSRRRWSGTGRWWRWRIGWWRANAVCPAKAGDSSRRYRHSASSKNCPTKNCRVETSRSHPRPNRECSDERLDRYRRWNGWPRRRSGYWGRNGFRNGNRHRERQRSRNGRRTRNSFSSHSHTVFFAAIACAFQRPRLPSDRILRRGREGKCKAAWIQCIPRQWLQSQVARCSYSTEVQAGREGRWNTGSGHGRHTIHFLARA